MIKTQSLVIGGGKRLKDIEKIGGVKPLFNVGEETVSIIKKAKYLGVTVGQQLNWMERTNFYYQEKSFWRNRNVEILQKVSPSSHNTKHV